MDNLMRRKNILLHFFHNVFFPHFPRATPISHPPHTIRNILAEFPHFFFFSGACAKKFH